MLAVSDQRHTFRRKGKWCPMKILVFAPQFLPIVGGIEILIDTLAQQFQKQSIETVVVTDRPGDLQEREVVNGVLVHRLEFSRAIEAQNSQACCGCCTGSVMSTR